MKRLSMIALGAAAAGAGLAGVWYARKEANSRPAGVEGPRIVILGAGFGGLTAARALRRELGRQARITLVDHHNYHLFTPMLYQVAAWAMDPYNVSFAIREFSGHNGVGFRRAMVTGADFANRQVQLKDGQIPYDYLVIALGSVTNFYGEKDAEKNSFPLKWLEDAVAMRNWTIDRVEQAVVTSDPQRRKALLSFVVIGGGATGVETAAALIDLLHHVLPSNYPTLNAKEVRVVIVEMANKLLGQMDDRMAGIALARLQQLGVEVWLNTKPEEVGVDYVKTSDGRTINCNTIVWSAGVRAPDVVAGLNLEHGKAGSIKVDEYLRVPNHPGLFAIGDNASAEDAQTHKHVPLLAQAAIQEGAAVAKNIARDMRGEPLLPFSYHSLGDALALGRASGVLETGGAVIDGFVGWLGWRVIHLARLTSFRDKLATVLDWSWGYLGDLDTTRLQVQPAPEPATIVGALHGG